MINLGRGVSQAVGRFFIFTIGYWKLAACHDDDDNIMYIVTCQVSLLCFCYIAFVNKNHSTSGPGFSFHFPSHDISQPSGGKRFKTLRNE